MEPVFIILFVAFPPPSPIAVVLNSESVFVPRRPALLMLFIVVALISHAPSSLSSLQILSSRMIQPGGRYHRERVGIG
jgi:hypothetical protein